VVCVATSSAVLAKVEQNIQGNKKTIDTFTSSIQSGAVTFEATYKTTGSSPATIVYAVEPPKGLAFSDTPSGGGGGSADIIVNASGEYACSPPSGSSSTASRPAATLSAKTMRWWISACNAGML
jgi:hypothetical protein